MYSILYVDDEPGLLEIGKIFLERNGDFSVDIAPSADEGLGLIATRGYDAIISDYQMPGMDGLVFLKEVRTKFGDIPFILFTGRGRESVVITAINDGVDYYLQKGGDPSAQFTELSHKVRRAVERKRMAALIRANEARFRELVDALPEIVFECDEKGTVTFVNQTGLSALGYTRADLAIPHNLSETVIPSERTLLMTRIAAVQERKQIPRGQEYTALRKDGSRFPAEAYSSPIIRDGKPAGLRGFIIDLTERKKTEEELRLLKVSVDAAADEVFWLDAQGTILNVNISACRATGYSRDELIGMKIFRLDPDFDSARWSESMSVLRTKKAQIFETRHRKKDGTMMDVEIMANHVTRGEEEFSFAFVRDVTEKKRAETELHAAYEQITAAEEELRQQYDELKHDEEMIRESEAQFRALFESGRDAILIVDGGIFRTCNSRTLEIFGCTSKDEIIGHSPLDFSPEYQHDGRTSRARIEENDEKVLAGTPLTMEWVHIRRDGTPFFAEISLSRIIVDGKRSIQAIVRDISDRKRAELAAGLAKRKLFMMNDVSRHVIRNKVTGLLGCADMACESSTPGECLDISREMKSLILEIQKQMDFTQEYERVGVTEPEWQGLRRAISGMESSGITFVSEFADVEIYADPLLGKIFLYLVENSLRHGVRVTEISLRSKERPEGLVLLYEDNGVGIPEERKKTIFEQRVGVQSGVGLFLVREILAITGITIIENGVPGKGVRFEITVPPGGYRQA